MRSPFVPLSRRDEPEAAARGMPPAQDGSGRHTGCCGWFESSHELMRGLRVQEHASPDAVADQLPLAAWLELHCMQAGVAKVV